MNTRPSPEAVPVGVITIEWSVEVIETAGLVHALMAYSRSPRITMFA